MPINKYEHITNEKIDEYLAMDTDSLAKIDSDHLKAIQKTDYTLNAIEENRLFTTVNSCVTRFFIKRGNKVFRVDQDTNEETLIPQEDADTLWTIFYMDDFKHAKEIFNLFLVRLGESRGGSVYCLHEVEDGACIHCGAICSKMFR